MTDHAALAPSSAPMWMSCPASITMAEGRTRPSSRYAREGTAAHKIAEMILGGNLFPPGKITVEGEQFIVGLPMLKALNPYISFVEDLRAKSLNPVHIEARVHLGGDPNSTVWGTADCTTLAGACLHVADLKYGAGVPVDPDSASLKIYALAAAATFWPNDYWTRAELTIVQPRLDPLPKTHVMTALELVAWRNEELLPAIRRIVRGDKAEKVGPYCRWCVRKHECSTFKTYKSSMAADIFDDGVDTLNT